MSYVNPKQYTVNASLTKIGRHYASYFPEKFKITKFAFADDEVNYALHATFGIIETSEYNKWISKIPVFEPNTYENLNLRHKLITRQRGVVLQPRLVLSPESSATVQYGSQLILKFSTINTDNDTDDAQLGYEVRIADPRVASFIGIPISGNSGSINIDEQMDELGYYMNRRTADFDKTKNNNNNKIVNNQSINTNVGNKIAVPVPPISPIPSYPNEGVMRGLKELQINADVDIRNLRNDSNYELFASTDFITVTTTIRVTGLRSGQEGIFTLTVEQPRVTSITPISASNDSAMVVR